MATTLFKLKISEVARKDIKQASKYYEGKQTGLGKRFTDSAKKSINLLRINPFFQIRYKNIRCLPLETFPFMLHYVVDEQNKLVEVFAVMNTQLDPEQNWL